MQINTILCATVMNFFAKNFDLDIVQDNVQLDSLFFTGGIDDILGNILTECRLLSVPVVYSMSRQALGLTLNRKVPVSAIGIFSYDGSEVIPMHDSGLLILGFSDSLRQSPEIFCIFLFLKFFSLTKYARSN